MKELIESKWPDILELLVKVYELSEIAVTTFIKPLTIQSVTEESITFYTS